jgi:hypothetical protein
MEMAETQETVDELIRAYEGAYERRQELLFKMIFNYITVLHMH